ncbi:hypothetical protein V5O48_018128, partial [Marasmius crinis-equi]
RHGAFAKILPNGSLSHSPCLPQSFSAERRLALGVEDCALTPATNTPLTTDDSILLDSSFRENLSAQLRLCYISPNITTYLDNIEKPIMSLICDNPTHFCLTAKHIQDQDFIPKLKSVAMDMSINILTRIQDQESLKTSKDMTIVPIWELTRQLSVAIAAIKCDVKITDAHLARIAFLRHCLTQFNKIDINSTASGEYDEPAFWSFVDCELTEMRSVAFDKGGDILNQRDMLSQYFRYVLDEDLKKYPGSKECWQSTHNQADVVNTWQRKIAIQMVF